MADRSDGVKRAGGYRDCRNSDTEDVVYFYKATNGEQLKLAFQDIGIKLTQLHLSQ